MRWSSGWALAAWLLIGGGASAQEVRWKTETELRSAARPVVRLVQAVAQAEPKGVEEGDEKEKPDAPQPEQPVPAPKVEMPPAPSQPYAAPWYAPAPPAAPRSPYWASEEPCCGDRAERCMHRLWYWVNYHPKFRCCHGVGCTGRGFYPCCRPPLYTYFICPSYYQQDYLHSCGGHGPTIAGNCGVYPPREVGCGGRLGCRSLVRPGGGAVTGPAGCLNDAGGLLARFRSRAFGD
jgi:hypothetical protein